MNLFQKPNQWICAIAAIVVLCSLCVVLSCSGFIRIEFQLSAHKDKIAELERELQMLQKMHERVAVRIDEIESKHNRNDRDVEPTPTIGSICQQCVKPWVREEIVSSVSYAVEEFCRPKTKLCLRGPPGSAGPKGDKGDKGDQGDPGVTVNGGIKSDVGGLDLDMVNDPKEEGIGSINAPGIRVVPALLAVNENAPAIFSCSSTVTGKSTITWSRIHGNLPGRKAVKVKAGKLKINRARRQDRGKYMCTVDSPRGLARAIVTLHVRGAPRIFLDSGPVYAEKGDNVSLPRCLATGYPTPVVSWQKVLDTMPEGRTVTSDQTMTILKAKRSDSGLYLCTANNPLGSAKATTHLVVVVRPRFTVRPQRKMKRLAGASLVVNCSATADPMPTITWEHCRVGLARKRYVTSGGKLTMGHLRVDDSGVYTCVATSKPLVARVSFEIKVKIARDCSVLYSAGVRSSGVYWINPDSRTAFSVFCDMDTDGGGWTVFQKRFDGSVNFFRRWKEYKSGFGDQNKEFWLGNNKVYRFTNAIPSELRVEVEDWTGKMAFAKYGNFQLSDERSQYRLTVGSYAGSAGDSLLYSNGMKFTTSDRDHDLSKENCAVASVGAWWYKSCHDSNLNGLYIKSVRDKTGMNWYYWKNNLSTVKASQMKLRPKGSK